MDIATTLALIIFTICITAPAIITALEQAGIFQRRSKCIKELEKKIEELEKTGGKKCTYHHYGAD